MKPALAHLWPTVPATLAAAVGIALSVFVLPGAGVQVGPTPLLPAIAAAAGRVAADLPPIAGERASEPVGKTASSAPLVATAAEHFVPRRRQAATTAHRAVHHGARTRVVRPAPPPAPVQVPAVPGAPVTTTTTATGKAHGHHGHALKPTAGAPASHAHGNGKGLGHSRGRHRGHGSGHATKAPTATPPTSTTPPNANGGGNGHKGGKK